MENESRPDPGVQGGREMGTFHAGPIDGGRPLQRLRETNTGGLATHGLEAVAVFPLLHDPVPTAGPVTPCMVCEEPLPVDEWGLCQICLYDQVVEMGGEA